MILRKIKNVIRLKRSRYMINSNYLYKFIDIRVSKGRETLKFKFRDNYGCDNTSSIKDVYLALILLDSTSDKYIRLLETGTGYLTAYITNDADEIYTSIGCVSQSLLIPIKNNEDMLKEMLLNMIFAKEYYNNYKMTNMIIKNDIIILESKNSELDIRCLSLPFTLSSNDRELYLVSEDDAVKGWYTVRTLSDVNVNENNTRAVILNKKQISDLSKMLNLQYILSFKSKKERKIV